MPHVVVKMYAGRTEEDKDRLAKALTSAVIQALGSKDEAVSVGIEDVAPADWMDTVYEPEITAKAATIFKRPGYGPLAAG